MRITLIESGVYTASDSVAILIIDDEFVLRIFTGPEKWVDIRGTRDAVYHWYKLLIPNEKDSIKWTEE